ncbi:MAG TPA: SDR family NAD(P)-dependent oxidoreductase, partial [Labilithrix sp.]|nr:SDR family NAD(P)-dependent oxidoreductase [Labilithrix sp.]
IIVGGFGPGISNAVAEKFGAEGFSVALVARSAERVAAGAKALAAKGIRAEAFPADLAKPEDIRATVKKIQASLGPVNVLHWNAYGSGAGDLTSAPVDELKAVFDVSFVGLITAVQAVLPDLRAEKGAVLVTNGGLGFFDPNVDAMGVQWNAMGLSVANSAKHKAVGLLHLKLKPEGIYVGEVTVTGIVKGTAWDQGNGTIDPAGVAAKFWENYQRREQTYATI